MAKEKRVVRAPSVGLLGLGLTGRGIATCLLGHGCHVVAYNRTRSRAVKARTFIGQLSPDPGKGTHVRSNTFTDMLHEPPSLPAANSNREGQKQIGWSALLYNVGQSRCLTSQVTQSFHG